MMKKLYLFYALCPAGWKKSSLYSFPLYMHENSVMGIKFKIMDIIFRKKLEENVKPSCWIMCIYYIEKIPT